MHLVEIFKATGGITRYCYSSLKTALLSAGRNKGICLNMLDAKFEIKKEE